MINAAGYLHLQRGEIAKSLEAFKFGRELFPESPNVYDSLANALEATGQLDEALRMVERAWALAAEQDDSRLDYYEEHRTRLRAKLRENRP